MLKSHGCAINKGIKAFVFLTKWVRELENVAIVTKLYSA